MKGYIKFHLYLTETSRWYMGKYSKLQYHTPNKVYHLNSVSGCTSTWWVMEWYGAWITDGKSWYGYSFAIYLILLCIFYTSLIIFTAVTAFTVTLARSAVVSFPQPIVQIHYQLFIKNPTGTFNYMAYIEPLHYLSWIVIGFFCIVTPLFPYMMTNK